MRGIANPPVRRPYYDASDALKSNCDTTDRMVKILVSILMLLSLAMVATAQIRPSMGQVRRENPLLDKLLSSDARIEVLASGMAWSEGPVWAKDGQYLLFSDIPNNSVMKWSEKEG